MSEVETLLSFATNTLIRELRVKDNVENRVNVRSTLCSILQFGHDAPITTGKWLDENHPDGKHRNPPPCT